MTFAPPAIFCEDCQRLTAADDVERRPHETVLIAECRCGHVVSRVFPTFLSRASSPPSARDVASRAYRSSRLRRSRCRTRSQNTTASSKRLPLLAGPSANDRYLRGADARSRRRAAIAGRKPRTAQVGREAVLASRRVSARRGRAAIRHGLLTVRPSRLKWKL